MSKTKHIVDEVEWKACEALGYVIYAPGVKLALTDFIKSHFPGLELLKFLKEIEVFTFIETVFAKSLFNSELVVVTLSNLKSLLLFKNSYFILIKLESLIFN